MKNNITASEIKTICSPYRLQSTIIENESKIDKYNGRFILCSTDMIIESKINLKQIVDMQNKNSHLIPIKYFVIKCDDNIPDEKIKSGVLLYCFKAEFIKNLYLQHTEVNGPDFIQEADYNRLLNMVEYKNNSNYNDDKHFCVETNIFEFMGFLTPAKKSEKELKWLDYRNSMRYDFSKSVLYNRFNYVFFKHKQKVSYPVLSQDLKSKVVNVYMSEREYKELKKRIKNYPDVVYYEHKKVKIDERNADDKKYKIEPLKFVHTTRKISIRENDENAVAGILQGMRYYAPEQAEFFNLIKSGERNKELSCEIVPAYIFYAFMDAAKKCNLEYTLDCGNFKNASMDEIPVVFKTENKEKFMKCANFIYNKTEDYRSPTLSDGYNRKSVKESLLEIEEDINDYSLKPVDVTDSVKQRYNIR